MDSRYFFVVGDQFRAFADDKDVITLGDLELLLNLPSRLLATRNILILGQGVPHEDVLAILSKCARDDERKTRFETCDLKRVEGRAPSSFSHKRFAHNTLIGTPFIADRQSQTYEVPLLIDERCELMADHQTGQHVQGMVIVEAFRQSFLAVTEAYFRPEGWERTFFVFNCMNTEFYSFVFPLPAHIEYRVLEHDTNERRAKYRVDMAALQNGVQCAKAAVTFTVYPSEQILAKEAALARSVTQQMLDELVQRARAATGLAAE